MTSRERLLWAAFERIKARPEEWNQEIWHCGSVGCLAFHICRAAEKSTLNSSIIDRNAAQLLGVDDTWDLFISMPGYHFAPDKIEWLRQHITTWLEKHGSDGKEVRAL